MINQSEASDLARALTGFLKQATSSLKKADETVTLNEYELKRHRDAIRKAVARLATGQGTGSDEYHLLKEVLDDYDRMYAERFGR